MSASPYNTCASSYDSYSDSVVCTTSLSAAFTPAQLSARHPPALTPHKPHRPAAARRSEPPTARPSASCGCRLAWPGGAQCANDGSLRSREHDPADARPEQRTRTHRARLATGKHRRAAQGRRAELRLRLPNQHHLGMAGVVCGCFGVVRGDQQNVAGGGDQRGAERAIALSAARCEASMAKRMGLRSGLVSVEGVGMVSESLKVTDGFTQRRGKRAVLSGRYHVPPKGA